jgi:hypothetical protein
MERKLCKTHNINSLFMVNKEKVNTSSCKLYDHNHGWFSKTKFLGKHE